MKRIMVAAGCIVVAFTLSSVATASAALPEFGKCVEVAKKTGEYAGKKCLKSAPGKGNFNWVPGAGAKPKFTTSVEEPVLRTTGAGKAQITCSFGEGEGEYTGAKTFVIKKLIFSGCQQAGAKTVLESWCQNVGSFRGEITAKELTGELGFIENAGKTKVGADLKATTGTALAMFECGGAIEQIPMLEIGSGTGTLLEIEGSVIGRVKFLNKAVEENLTTYTVKNSAQVPEQFEGGVKDTLTALVGLTKTAEPATFGALEETINEEEIEIRAKSM